MTTPSRPTDAPTPEAMEASHRIFDDIGYLMEGKFSERVRAREDVAHALDTFAAARVREAVEKERARCFRWAIGRVPRSEACRAIRDGDLTGEVQCDPNVCWRCGIPLHPGHFCGEQP